jgi:hypothetical protein
MDEGEQLTGENMSEEATEETFEVSKTSDVCEYPNAPQRNPFLRDQTYHFYHLGNNRQAVFRSAFEGRLCYNRFTFLVR